MTVSYFDEHKLRVHRIEAGGTLTLLHTFGGKGAGPKQFSCPVRMCLVPNGNLLVCDRANNRVQELTGLGEAEPAHFSCVISTSLGLLRLLCMVTWSLSEQEMPLLFY